MVTGVGVVGEPMMTASEGWLGVPAMVSLVVAR